MFAFIRLLLSAAVSMCSSIAIAKEIPGLPKELAGATFGANAEDCRTYFDSIKTGRIQDQLVTVFGKKDGAYTYGDCDVACYAGILSYQTVKNGYVVKMRWIGSGGNRIEHLSVTRRDGNKLRFQFLPLEAKEATRDYIRCQKPE